jgi:hypothetical protein
MQFMYEARIEERHAFGSNWCGPDIFPHATDVVVARYEKTCDDGFVVEITCYALPARCYRVVALPGENSCNEPRPGFTLSTGSGNEARNWCIMTARLIADGMISSRDTTD